MQTDKKIMMSYYIAIQFLIMQCSIIIVFGRYLFWLKDNQLVKHDLANDSVYSADVIITSKVSTYSVVYDNYDLYSIYEFNDSYSEITLTFLDGKVCT